MDPLQILRIIVAIGLIKIILDQKDTAAHIFLAVIIFKPVLMPYLLRSKIAYYAEFSRINSYRSAIKITSYTLLAYSAVFPARRFPAYMEIQCNILFLKCLRNNLDLLTSVVLKAIVMSLGISKSEAVVSIWIGSTYRSVVGCK